MRLSRPSAQHDARIDASKTETVRYRMRDRHAPGFASDKIDALRKNVRIFKIKSGRGHLVALTAIR
jgi:hypothetical protein